MNNEISNLKKEYRDLNIKVHDLKDWQGNIILECLITGMYYVACDTAEAKEQVNAILKMRKEEGVM